jgi:hypothetical protein
MAEKTGTPLTSIQGFPETVAARLAELWITTAEEMNGIDREENGRQGLADYLGISQDEVAALIGLLPVSFPSPEPIEFHGMGALDESEGAEPDAEPVSFAPLPGSVDLHDRMPPVRNQRNRGTCVAHASVAVREFLLGPPPQSTSGDLSEQFLYWDCKRKDGMPAEEGTWIRVAMACLQEDGVCPEEIWPYNPNPVPGNEGQDPPPAGAAERAAGQRIASGTQLQPRWVTQLKQTLADSKPIAFAVPVYAYWMSDPVRGTGDIRMPLSSDRKLGGHAMCLVGYEDDKAIPGGGAFLVRNSWGTDWAQNSAVAPGYARLPYDYLAKFGSSAYAATMSTVPPGPGDTSSAGWLQELWKRLFGGS